MRTDSREMLARGIFGRASLRERIEVLVRREGGLPACLSPVRVVGSVSMLMILAAAGSVAPRWIAFAQGDVRPTFDVTSVKPDDSPNVRMWLAPPVGGTFAATKVNLKTLMVTAYGVPYWAIVGGSSWIGSDTYDVTGKVERREIRREQLGPMLQTLLEQRFQLTVHHEQREMPVYALRVANGGLRLADAQAEGCAMYPAASASAAPCEDFLVMPTVISAKRLSMKMLAGAISNILHRPVIDETGYTGSFRVRLEFSPEGEAGDGDPARPALSTALREEMGLRLDSRKRPGEVLVVDHVERPDAN